MATATRASLDEVRDFANKVREAGGGNPLDALMPAVPADTKQCLIARNLNFNCEVGSCRGDGTWAMWVDDSETAEKIGNALDLEVDERVVILPPEIGKVAEDFDRIGDEFLNTASKLKNDYEYAVTKADTRATFQEWIRSWYPGELDQIKEFWPYIEESIRETHNNGVFNDKGELIL